MKSFRALLCCLSICLVSLALSTVATPPAYADQGIEISASTDRIMGGIMSPYCPGRLLKDCPSGQALQLKEKIISRLTAGETEQAIVDDLIATFGEEVRASPRASGFGLVAWLAPSLFLIFGATLILLWLRNRSTQSDTPTSAPALDAESERRLSRLIDFSDRNNI